MPDFDRNYVVAFEVPRRDGSTIALACVAARSKVMALCEAVRMNFDLSREEWELLMLEGDRVGGYLRTLKRWGINVSEPVIKEHITPLCMPRLRKIRRVSSNA